MDISQHHFLYDKYSRTWQMISDLIEGEERVKSRKTRYLPFPVSLPENIKSTEHYIRQYEIYLAGANYVNYTSQAVNDLVASVFSRDPLIADNFPEELLYLSLGDIARDLTETVVSFGRALLFVDYPVTGQVVSQQEQDRLKIRAYYSIIPPLDVLDWTTQQQGGTDILTMVFVREINQNGDTEEYNYRKMFLQNGVFVIEVYDESGQQIGDTITPKANGRKLNYVPGVFVGSMKNSNTKLDKPPVLGIANTSVKHYQNTAELQHCITYIGHPMVSITGAPEGFIAKMNTPAEDGSVNTISIGASNALIIEGEQGQVDLMQINSDLVHFKRLEQLEANMAEQGYRLKSDKAGVESAEALRMRSSVANSQLASIATQVEKAIQKSMFYINAYMGTSVPLDFEFKLVKDYLRQTPDANLINTLNGLINSGRLPDYVLYKYMVDSELLTENDDFQKLRDDSKAEEEF